MVNWNIIGKQNKNLQIYTKLIINNKCKIKINYVNEP